MTTSSDNTIDPKERIEDDMKAMEAHMAEPGFWDDKRHATEVVARYEELKAELSGVGKYDRGSAIVTILAGAGGDDAEDFARMLTEMYYKFADKKGFKVGLLHENKNDHGGYRNITFELEARGGGGTQPGPYGILSGESGVHRLVRLSPFNANQKRHTSFAMVEVIPKLPRVTDLKIPEDEIKTLFAKSGGAGGQNVNKRETAVRVVHIPTNLSVHISSERSQLQNKEKALEILRGKLFKMMEEARAREGDNFKLSKTTQIEWGNQIRSYVLHPYQMVKDHKRDIELSDVEGVLDGDIAPLLNNS